VVGAGFDDALFAPGRKPDPEPVQLVYAGKLSRAKGVPWLLRALARIDTPAWRLHLVGGGSGEEKAACLELAAALGERVVVHGAVPQTALAGIVSQCHVLVLPSIFEGLPLVVLEGLAGGCRIVATRLPGVEELLGDLRTDAVSLVRLPRMRNLDQPFQQDEAAFEEDLLAALRRQIAAAGRNPEIDIATIRKRVDAFTWRCVYGRVQDVYDSVV